MAYGDLKVRNLIWNTGSGDNTVVLSTLATQSYVTTNFAPKSNPSFTGTINGADLILSGNLTVNGTQTIINTQTLDVEDKQIEIGKVSSPSDTTADQGGLKLKGASDKTFLWVNATVAWTSSEHIHVPDNKRFMVGTARDLQIFNDGTTNQIHDANSQGLRIRTSDFKVMNEANNAALLYANQGGAVELYFNNTKAAETTAFGLNVNNPDATDAKIELTSSGGYLGYVYGQSSDNSFGLQTESSEWIIKGITDGSVSLFYNNNLKFKTVSGGVRTNGNLELLDNHEIQLGSGTDCKLFHDGNHSYLSNTSGSLFIKSSHQVYIQDDQGRKQITCVDGGAVELYHGGVDAVKLATTSTGINVTGQINVNGSPLSAAPEVSLVADGAIAANKPVAVQSDGKIKEIKEFAVSASKGSLATLDGNQGNDSRVHDVCAVGDDKFVVVWIADQDGDDVYAACGQYSGTTISSVGAAVKVCDNAGERQVRVAYDETSGAIMVIATGNSTFHQRAASISGTTLTFGTVIETSYSAKVCDLAAGDGGFVSIKTSVWTTEVQAYTVSGNTITAGTASTSNMNSGGYRSNEGALSIVYDSANKNFVMCGITDSGDMKGHVITKSETSVTNGSANSLGNANNKRAVLAYDSTTGQVFITYQESYDLYGNIWTISGTSISKGTAVNLDSANPQNMRITYVPESNKAYVLVRDGSDGHYTSYMELTNTNGTISGGSFVQVLNAEEHYFAISYLTKGKFITAFRLASSSNTAKGEIYQRPFTDSSLGNGYIGFSSAAINDTATGTIAVTGNTNSSQSGLTAGKKHYVTRTGGLSTQPATPSVEAGIALSSTKLLIKG